MTQTPTILALDVGEKRIGVAIATVGLHFAHPLTTLSHDGTIWQQLTDLVETNATGLFVVGLPRGLDGQETAQTRTTEVFMQQLRANIGLPIQPQDESVTSIKAEAELKSRGKPYEKGDIDALAATYILEDYLNEQGAGSGEV
jgi:putative Holliday junction resolvase